MSKERPHLLLIDDAPEMGLIVGRYCRRSDWDLSVCGDAPAALDWLTDRRPDLILLDLKLPGIGGVELCRQLRSQSGGAMLWVALYTQWGTTADIPAGLDAGADFVVAKDLAARPDAWTRRVAEILKRTHGRQRRRPVAWHGVQTSSARVATDWAAALARAVRHVALRPLGADVLLWLVRRSLADVFLASEQLPSAWTGLLLDATGRPAEGSPEAATAPAVAAALAVRTWCLLGAEAGAPVLDALRHAVPGLSELLTRS
jgi:DNA-binding response OmpR family regulator